MSRTDGYCRNVFVLTPGDVMPWQPCIDCGHTLLAHIGVEHCPVCELAGLAEQHRIEAVEAERPPVTGDRLHLWSSSFFCLAGTVVRPMVFGPGLLIKIDRHDVSLKSLVADAQDESRSISGSWHWPCDGDSQEAAPVPVEPPTQVTGQIHIDGPRLHGAINKQLLAEYRDYPGPLSH